MKTITFLVSGGGGNLKFFYHATQRNLISGVKLIVIADRECQALAFAKNHGIEHHLITYTKSTTEMLNRSLEYINPDAIVSNWYKIIDEDIVDRYRGKLVNLHYSLLPAFGGLIGVEPIKRAYEQGCKFIGPTCHLVDNGVDTGKILSQAIFTTERPFEDAVKLMFRKGCLVLLNGLQQILAQNILTDCARKSRGSYPQEDALGLYSPQLGFDESLFDEEFWKEIATA